MIGPFTSAQVRPKGKIVTEPTDGLNTTLILLLASTAKLMVALDVMVVTTALPRIGREFGA
jgi:hypothetical protein